MKPLSFCTLLVSLLSNRQVGVAAFSSYLDMLGKLYGYGYDASSPKYSTKAGQDSNEASNGASNQGEWEVEGSYQVPADGIRALSVEQQGAQGAPVNRQQEAPELSDKDYMSILNLLEEAAAASLSSFNRDEEVVAARTLSDEREQARELRVSQAEPRPDGGAFFSGARWGSNSTMTAGAGARSSQNGPERLDQVRLEMEAVKADLELLRTLAMEVSSTPTEVEGTLQAPLEVEVNVIETADAASVTPTLKLVEASSSASPVSDETSESVTAEGTTQFESTPQAKETQMGESVDPMAKVVAAKALLSNKMSEDKPDEPRIDSTTKMSEDKPDEPRLDSTTTSVGAVTMEAALQGEEKMKEPRPVVESSPIFPKANLSQMSEPVQIANEAETLKLSVKNGDAAKTETTATKSSRGPEAKQSMSRREKRRHRHESSTALKSMERKTNGGKIDSYKKEPGSLAATTTVAVTKRSDELSGVKLESATAISGLPTRPSEKGKESDVDGLSASHVVTKMIVSTEGLEEAEPSDLTDSRPDVTSAYETTTESKSTPATTDEPEISDDIPSSKSSPLEANYISAYSSSSTSTSLNIGVKWNSTTEMGATDETKSSTNSSGVTSKSTTASVAKTSNIPTEIQSKEEKVGADSDVDPIEPPTPTSVDASEAALPTLALKTSDASAAVLVAETASLSVENEAFADAHSSSVVPVVSESADDTGSAQATLSLSTEIEASEFEESEEQTLVDNETAPMAGKDVLDSDTSTSVDMSESRMSAVSAKSVVASFGVNAVGTLTLIDSDVTAETTRSSSVKKSYSGFGVKPQAGKPFVGKTMPDYRVETKVVSSDAEKPKSGKPSITELADDKGAAAIVDEDIMELVHPPPPNPVDVIEQLSTFSATTASSRSSDRKSDSSTAASGTIARGSETNHLSGNEVEESPRSSEHSLSFDASEKPVIESGEKPSVQGLVPTEKILEPDETSDDGDSKAILSPPPEPEAVDIAEQLSAFSLATAATETVDAKRPSPSTSSAPDSLCRDLLQSTGAVETKIPTKSSSTATLTLPGNSGDAMSPEKALLPIDAPDPDYGSSANQVIDMTREAHALSDQNKLEKAEILFADALNALESISEPVVGAGKNSESLTPESSRVADEGCAEGFTDVALTTKVALKSQNVMEAQSAGSSLPVVVSGMATTEERITGDDSAGINDDSQERVGINGLDTESIPVNGASHQDLVPPISRPFFLDVIEPNAEVASGVTFKTHTLRKSGIECAISVSDSKRLVAPASFENNWLDEAAALVQPMIKSLQPIVSGFIKGAFETLQNLPQNLPKPREPPPFEDEVEDETVLDTSGMTERIMMITPVEGQATGAGGASTWEAFQRAERNWKALKESKVPRLSEVAEFVTDDGAKGNPKCWQRLNEQEGKEPDYDVVVCGGTLGIFFATALQLKGHRVAVLEAGKLRGREQEWNLSMDELLELVKFGVLSQGDVDAVVTTEFPGCRSGFKNKEMTPLEGGYFDNGIGYECFTPAVLNLGVAPSILLEKAAQRFRELGGVVMEETRLKGVVVSKARGAAVDLGADVEPVTAHLVLDCMGNGSPISLQQRRGVKPDGVCAVVGSCASGYDKETNTLGDIIYTNSLMQDKGEHGMLQYFWEAFPVGIGRNGKEPGSSDTKTTYMFTYMDANAKRPSLETLMEDYWRMLPKYQPSISNPETDLDVKRVLFAYFPTYRESPLKPHWSRILAVGDASGIQSPLSFGGLGALTRHLDRISTAVSEALDKNFLDKEDLSEINAYLPNLSASWMFQRAMSVRVGSKVDPTFVNRLLATNFEIMDTMGQRTIKPFLQDVVRFDSLVGSLARAFVADPGFMPDIVNHVGLPTLLEWLAHVTMMGAYSLLDTVASPLVRVALATTVEDERTKFQWHRRMEAWKYGSGNDYVLPKDN